MMHHLAHKRIRAIFLFSAILIFFGTGFFMILEHWSFIDAFYFTVSTMTTVGYGDITPSMPASRFIATIYMMTTVPLLLISIGVLSESVYYDKNPERIIKR